MAWNDPVSATTGELFTASRYNTDVVGNLVFLKTSVSGAGDVWTGNVQKVAQTFRGLRVRTHPDLDVAATKVAVLGLDEVIMNDGTRYQPTAFPLVADISAAGAGGLDFGTEQPSTWYDYYLIGKSSTRAISDLRTIFHRSKDYFKDTSFETPFDTSRGLRIATGTATDKIAQGFQLATAGKVEFIDITLARVGAVSGRIWLTIEASVVGAPSGTPLATSDKLDASVMNTTSVIYTRFIFRTPATLSAGTQYHMVLQGDYSRSDTVNVIWGGVVAGSYANGSSQDFNGTTWAATPGPSGIDRQFKVFVTRNDAALVLPTGYDQFIKLAPAYNNSSSNFSPFTAIDKHVRWLTQKLLGSITATVPTIFDMSSIIPPGQIKVHAVTANGSVANNFISGVPDGYNITQQANGVEGGTSIVTSYAIGSSWGTFSPFITEFQGAYSEVSTGQQTPIITGFTW